MSFPRYPAYKDSGVSWLRQVPAHWCVDRLKLFANVTMGQSPASEDCNLEGDGLPFMQGNAEFGRRTPAPRSFCAVASKVAKPGDVLLSVRAPVGEVNIADQPVGIGRGLCALTAKAPNDPVFLFYALQAMKTELLSVATGSTYEAVTTDQVGSASLPVAGADEQVAIAAFLDRETAKIDALVAEQERLIELLKEKRQAVISHAVTKGLNPAAPMKDSGIEWLGQIPAHWEVGPVKRYLQSLDGRRVPLSAEQRSSKVGEYPYYGASGIIDWIDDYIFDEDLVLVSEDGANLVNRSTPIAFVATGKYWVNNHAHILRARDPHLTFWAEAIERIDLTPVITGSAQPKLTSEALFNLRIAVPPTDEERGTIAAYITKQDAKLTAMTLEAKRATELLQERRAALISAAVTGQIDVRSSAARSAA